MKKILYFIQLPPPVHGPSTMHEIIYNSSTINRDIDKSLLEIKFSTDINQTNKLTAGKIFIFLKVIIQLYSRIKKFKPDYIFFNIQPIGKGFYRDIFFVMLIKALRVKPIYTLHCHGIRKRTGNRTLNKIYKFIFSNSVIIHLSKTLLENEIAPLDPVNSKLYFVENGIENVNTSNVTKTNNPVAHLLFLSNIFTSKGIFVLLEAFKILSNRLDNVRLVIIGNSVSESIDAKVHSFISEHSLTSIVEYRRIESSDEKHQFLNNADIFVLPTLWDTFPLVLLEAMQFGLPVVSTFEGGIPEIVDDEITGFLVEKNNAVALADKIETLVKDHKLRIEMGERGRQKFLNEFTREKYEHRMREVFDAL